VTSPPLRGERAWCSGRSDPRALAILHEWLKATGTEMNMTVMPLFSASVQFYTDIDWSAGQAWNDRATISD
jgi:hypothetical protein